MDIVFFVLQKLYRPFKAQLELCAFVEDALNFHGYGIIRADFVDYADLLKVNICFSPQGKTLLWSKCEDIN